MIIQELVGGRETSGYMTYVQLIIFLTTTVKHPWVTEKGKLQLQLSFLTLCISLFPRHCKLLRSHEGNTEVTDEALEVSKISNKELLFSAPWREQAAQRSGKQVGQC